MTIRTFTREQLDSLGVPFDLPTNPATAPKGAAIELHDEQIESRRWVAVHELVFRAPDDGKAYRVHYERGLTEVQEDTDPWNYAREIEAAEVVQRAQITNVWKPVAETVISSETAAHVLFQERLGGWPPSTFAAKLLDAWTSADTANAERLAVAFPEYAAAIALLKSGPDGIEQLRAIADGT